MIKNIRYEFIGLGLILLIILFLFLLPETQAFQHAQEEYSIAILLDLLITIPILYYFFIRKTKISKFTVIYWILIGTVLASIIIPIEHQVILSKVKTFVIPVIELGIISLLIHRVISLKKSYKENQSTEDDFYTRILKACDDIFPGRIGKVMATEIAVFYYLNPFKKATSLATNRFTYFKKNGIKTMVSVFLFLLLIETAVVHLLVAKWNNNVAWVLTILGLYAGLQIFSIVKSMNKRLISIDYESERLNLKYGFACESSIKFSHIERIEKNRRSITNSKNHACLSIFSMIDTPNVIIYLNEKQVLHKVYGIKKKYDKISLYVDEKELFVSKIEEIINRALDGSDIK